MKVNSLSNKSDMWPKRLNNLHTPPKQLFYRGEYNTARPRVAIVGTRKCSEYGRKVTQQFAGFLAEQGVTIVSGLAIGIDSIAHIAALDAGGQTIAILPSSLDSIYPRRHRALANRIESAGAVITEYSPGHIMLPHHFIARNRLVAAFADLLLVTEATIKSGTSHTVNFALELGIDVAAVPGPITSKLSQGTNHHIKNGCALVDSPEEVLSMLGLSPNADTGQAMGLSLSSGQQHIIQALMQLPMTIDDLLQETGGGDVAPELMELELNGIVDRSPDGTYNLAKPIK